MRKRFLPLAHVALLAILGTQAAGQAMPSGVTKEELAKNNKLFIELATKALH